MRAWASTPRRRPLSEETWTLKMEAATPALDPKRAFGTLHNQLSAQPSRHRYWSPEC